VQKSAGIGKSVNAVKDRHIIASSPGKRFYLSDMPEKKASFKMLKTAFGIILFGVLFLLGGGFLVAKGLCFI
jgi:hypothetical protein